MKNLGIAFSAISLLLAGFTANSLAQAPVTGTMPFNYPQSTLLADVGVGADLFGSLTRLEPALYPPRLFVAWSPNASSLKLAATANVYGDALNNGYGEGTIEWSTNGLWLGLSLPVRVNERLSADLQGWYFVPGNGHIAVSGRASGLNNGVFQSGAVSGNLDIKTTWFAIDLEGCCRASSGFAILAGVRYDYVQGSITAPAPLEALLDGHFPGLRAKLDLNLNSIFPYLGARSIFATGLGSLTFSAKGFPWAISVADVHPKSGYFAEVFFSYDLVPSRDFSLSFFAKADWARAVFEEFSQVANIFNKNPSVPQNLSLQQTLPVTWQQYLIGGVATLNFGFSFL